MFIVVYLTSCFLVSLVWGHDHRLDLNRLHQPLVNETRNNSVNLLAHRNLLRGHNVGLKAKRSDGNATISVKQNFQDRSMSSLNKSSLPSSNYIESLIREDASLFKELETRTPLAWTTSRWRLVSFTTTNKPVISRGTIFEGPLILEKKRKPVDSNQDYEPKSEKDNDESDNPTVEESDQEPNESKDERKTTYKTRKVGKSRKEIKKSSKKITDDQETDFEDNNEQDQNTRKLTKDQLKQVYSFIKSKEKENQKNPKKIMSLIESLIKSPNNEVYPKLRDSIAAKAANRALLKWHLSSPAANLDELENMYNKCYDYFYQKLASMFKDDDKQANDEFELDESFQSSNDDSKPSSRHRTHFSEYLSLLDFLKDKLDLFKVKESNDVVDESGGVLEKKQELDKLIQFYERNKHDSVEDLVKKYSQSHQHYLNHHPILYRKFFNYINDPAYLKLRSEMNTYTTQNMAPPLDLLNRYHQYLHTPETVRTNLVEPSQAQQASSYTASKINDLTSDDQKVKVDRIRNYYQYNQHPFYDESGRQVIFTSGNLESIPQTGPAPASSYQSQIVCKNYPEHSNEGFKSFISIESCTQPSLLSSSGMPVFSNGCTFRYICDLGYQPLGGSSAAIRCTNGFWSSKATCMKQEIQAQTDQQIKPIGVQSILTKREETTNSHKIRKRSDEVTLVEDNGSTTDSTPENSTVSIVTDSVEQTTSIGSLNESTVLAETSTDSLLTTTEIPQTSYSTDAPATTTQVDLSNSTTSQSTSLDLNDLEKTIYESFYELLDNRSSSDLVKLSNKTVTKVADLLI